MLKNVNKLKKQNKVTKEETDLTQLAPMPDAFQKAWDNYEESRVRDQQENYLNTWWGIYCKYRKLFFENCPTKDSHLNKQQIRKEWQLTWNEQLEAEIAQISDTHIKLLNDKISGEWINDNQWIYCIVKINRIEGRTMDYIIDKECEASSLLRINYCKLSRKANELDYKAMRYLEHEIHQNEELLYHKTLRTNEILFVKRCKTKRKKKLVVQNNKNPDQNVDGEEWLTTIYVSNNYCLTRQSPSRKTIRKKVDLVTFSDKHLLMALYCKNENRVVFYLCSTNLYQMKEQRRLMINFSQFKWANEMKHLKYILFDDSNKSLVIIDNRNELRVYNIHTTNWESRGQALQLKNNFDHFLLTRDGSFLLAFKPTTNDDDDGENDTNDDSKDDSKKCDFEDESKTNRVKVAVFFLPKRDLLKTEMLPECFTVKTIKNVRLKYVESNDVWLMNVVPNVQDPKQFEIIYIKVEITTARSHLSSNVLQLGGDNDQQRLKTKVECIRIFLNS